MDVKHNRLISGLRAAAAAGVEGAQAALALAESTPASYLRGFRKSYNLPKNLRNPVHGAHIPVRLGVAPMPCINVGGAEKDMPFRIDRLQKLKDRRHASA